MTPVPLDLPLRPPEAAQLAGLILESAERRPLTPELRARIAARASALSLESFRPWFGSLARDPVHHATYYLAVDPHSAPPVLLHMARANAPTSAIFSRPLLIGRVGELVVNAIPFAHTDVENIALYAGMDPAVLPKPRASQSALVARIEDPAADLPAAFAAFGVILNRTGKNLAAVTPGAAAADPAAFHAAAVWAAIRAGWREGFSTAIHVAAGSDVRSFLRAAAPFTRFSVDLEAAAQIYPLIREARSTQKIPAPFDFEARLPPAIPAEETAAALDRLHADGRHVHLIAAGDRLDLADFVVLARRYRAVLSREAVAVERIEEAAAAMP